MTTKMSDQLTKQRVPSSLVGPRLGLVWAFMLDGHTGSMRWLLGVRAGGCHGCGTMGSHRCVSRPPMTGVLSLPLLPYNGHFCKCLAKLDLLDSAIPV